MSRPRFSTCSCILVASIALCYCKSSFDASNQSSVELDAPALTDFPENIRQHIHGYQITIKPKEPSDLCQPQQSIYSYSDNTTNLQLTTGCNYWVTVIFGKISKDKSAIDPVLYTSTDPATGKQISIDKEDILAADNKLVNIRVFPQPNNNSVFMPQPVDIRTKIISSKSLEQTDINNPLHPSTFSDGSQSKPIVADPNDCAAVAHQIFNERIAGPAGGCASCHQDSKVLRLVYGNHEGNYIALRKAIYTDKLLTPFTLGHQGGLNTSTQLLGDFKYWQNAERKCSEKPAAKATPTAAPPVPLDAFE